MNNSLFYERCERFVGNAHKKFAVLVKITNKNTDINFIVGEIYKEKIKIDHKMNNRSFKWIEIIIKCDMIEPSNETAGMKNPQEINKKSVSFG